MQDYSLYLCHNSVTMEELQKKFASEVKGLDDAQGVVEAYANAYNNEDSDGDISHPSSFVKTVSENFKKIRVYKNHDIKQMIGVPKELNALDPFGLFTVTQFNMNTDLGKDMYHDVKLVTDNGQEADLSIGYKVLRRDQKNAKIITEYSLKEYSFLTSWGANSRAIATGIKSLESVPEIITHLTKMYNLPYSDSRLMQVETILKALTVAPEESTQLVEPQATKSIFSLITN
jgi:HK97 family phage prohead protease